MVHVQADFVVHFQTILATPTSISLPAYAQANSSVGYLVPTSCTAYTLDLTVEIIQHGAIVAQHNAALGIEQLLPVP
jgi:hypothetical protein